MSGKRRAGGPHGGGHLIDPASPEVIAFIEEVLESRSAGIGTASASQPRRSARVPETPPRDDDQVLAGAG